MKKEFIVAFFFTVIILLLNYFLRTMLQYTPVEWESVYQLHQTEIPFRLRPYTNIIMYSFVHYFKWSIPVSFIIQQYTLLYFFFISMAFYLKELSFTKRERLIGLSITAFTFPILCLHFIPNYTWDNLWMYIGLIWFGYFLIKQKFYVASLLLLFSAISHESSFFVVIGFYFFRKKSDSHVKWILPAIIPVITYLVIRFFVFPDVMTDRFLHLRGNFENADAIRQTLFSILVSFGWMWAVMLWGITRVKNTNKMFQVFLYSSLFASIITVCIVLFVGKARETRLFYAPFLYIIPLVLFYIKDFFDGIELFYCRTGKISFYGISFVLLVCSVLLTIFIFPSFSYLPMIDFHRVYFILNLFIILLVFLSMVWKKI